MMALGSTTREHSGLVAKRMNGAKNLLSIALLLVLSGCSDGTVGEGVGPSAVSESPADSSTHEAAVDRDAQQVAGEEAQDRMYSCLEERGFRVERAPDGSATIHQPEADTDGEITRAAMKECEESADFPELISLTEQEINGLYDLSVEAEACLREAGFSPAPAVSREQFVQDYRSSDGSSAWTPFEGIANIEAAERVCPQPQLTDL